MRSRSLVALIPLLLLAACERPMDTPGTPDVTPDTTPATEPAPATPAPGVRSEPMTGQAPAGTPMAGQQAAMTAQATLQPTEGNTAAGDLTLVADTGGVRISGHLHGLQPDTEHGFHIHENGDCSAPDASSAGAHFSPDGKPHGSPDSDESHAGDMPNLRSDAAGNVQVDVRIDRVQLGGGGNDIVNRAVVLHQKADDYTSQPSGESGARIACGVIRAGGEAAPAPMQ